MARATFGRSGQRIIVTEGNKPATIDVVNDTDEQSRTADSDDNSGTTPDFEYIGGDGNGEASGEIGSASVETGETSGSGTTFTDPATATAPRKRGPKPGTKYGPRGPRTKKDSADAKAVSVNLEKVLFAMHTLAAGMLAEPELAISAEDSAILAEAVKGVAEAYSFSAVFNPKVTALIDLGLVCTTIYGPKFMVIAKRSKKSNVINMPTQTARTAGD